MPWIHCIEGNLKLSSAEAQPISDYWKVKTLRVTESQIALLVVVHLSSIIRVEIVVSGRI